MEIEAFEQAAVRGDETAFVRLMESRKVQLYKIAYAYLGSEPDALEAVQEVTCRAWLRIGKLKEPRYAASWLVRIMIHYCIDELKKRKRTIPSEAGELWESLLEPDVTAGDAAESLSMREIVDSLDEPYRQVIRMKYYDDLTVTEIARRLDRPSGTVKTWLHKALGGLRERLTKEGKHHG